MRTIEYINKIETAVKSNALSERKKFISGMDSKLLLLIILSVCVLSAIVLSTCLGAYKISPLKVISIMLSKIGISLSPFELSDEAVLISIRLPRIFLALLIGGGLSLAGTVLQTLFRNPLADPALIGISSGSALAAVIYIFISSSLYSVIQENYLLPLIAFFGGLISTFFVYKLSLINGRSIISTMLLAGIAVNALNVAGIGYISYLSDDAQLRFITFWLLGSLGGSSWSDLFLVLPFIVVPSFLLFLFWKKLNALLLGEAEAGHIGVNVNSLKKWIILSSALIVGTAVSISGIIGFIGLVVPHLFRIMAGADHKYLLPGSVILGGLLLLLSDLAARMIAIPAEVPIGIITSALGAPFFIWLLLKDKRKNSFL